MDMSDYEMRGRAVVQHFYTELEKIAYSRKTKMLYEAARKARGQAQESAETLGWSRFVPFTQAHRAHYGHLGREGSGMVGRANQLANQAEAQAKKERAMLLKALEEGKGNRENILKRLQEGPQNLDSPLASGRQVARSAGISSAPVDQEAFKKKPKGFFSSPMARGAALGVGGVGLGVAGLYAGQQYLQSQQQPSYGGY